MGRGQSSTTWQKGFADVVLKRGPSGAHYKCKCKFCGKPVSGQPGRFISHLLQVKGGGVAICDQSLCKKDPDLEDECQNLLIKLQKEADAKPRSQKQQDKPGSSAGASASGSTGLSSWVILGSTPANVQASDALAAWIAQCGIAFNQVDNKAFDEFVAAAIKAGSAWKKPSRRTLTRTISKLADLRGCSPSVGVDPGGGRGGGCRGGRRGR